ncbi:MAG: hypothetical protein A2Z96_02750 [Spirochaetes bacterium GWB1_48_6]|nr:MAG: hypothetical protein A2Z96_02750 [Spirochaetes bacterium GWB1_48_6]
MLSTKFDQALLMAAELHRKQVRKSTGAPYLTHLLAVAVLVLENGGSESAAIAALLHDAAEDQGGRKTLETIAQNFTMEIAQLVEDLSDSLEDTTGALEKTDWKERKVSYLKALASHSPDALLISFCDKFHNLESLVQALETKKELAWELFKGKKEGTRWYYQELDQVFSTKPLPPYLFNRWKFLLQQIQIS